jgi:hypothetical protein
MMALWNKTAYIYITFDADPHLDAVPPTHCRDAENGRKMAESSAAKR